MPWNAPANTATIDSVYLMGAKLKGRVRESITSAPLSMSTSQVTQLTLNFIDPRFTILRKGLFKTRMPVRYKDLRFVISNVETTSLSGNEGVTVKCRPYTVQRLKERRGSKVMKKASPSDFVRAECKAIGAKYYIQPSAKRSSVARDRPKKDQKYDLDQTPSSYTTFVRLADELGFAFFEMAGVIYFAKPSYILNASKKSPLVVTWKRHPRTDSETVPVCTKSIDSKEVSIQVTLPLHRAKEARVGRALRLGDVPGFGGYYLIDSVDYNLSGRTSRVIISASSAIDPEANPPPKPQPKKSPTSGGSTPNRNGGSIYKSIATSTQGSWPISRKYRIGTPFGRRGSWAAGYHTGVDFPAPRGTPVYAVYSGTIRSGNWGSAYGKHVLLEVGGRRYGYCHLSKIKVHSGQFVRSGQILGWVGNTGRSFGNHLHFELRVSPYRYGRNSRNPIPTLGKKITVRRKIAIKRAPSSGSSNSKTAADFVGVALRQKGDRYVFGAPRRTSGDPSAFDCSSLVYYALARVGIRGVPQSTHGQQPYFQRKGGRISITTAYRTRGALLYRMGGQFNHVAISLGNGRTIEAMNSRVGVVVANARGRGWTHAYKVKGLRY